MAIAAWEWGTLLGKDEVTLGISSYQRPDPKSLPASAKLIGNYTNSILAGHEARTKGYDEAMMLDSQGNISQTPGSNFFLEKDGVLYTAPEGNILPGITRKTILVFNDKYHITVSLQDFNGSLEQLKPTFNHKIQIPIFPNSLQNNHTCQHPDL